MIMATSLRSRCDWVAKCLLVVEFAVFPISLALANTLVLLILLFWLVAGSYKKRWMAIKNHPLTWPLLILFFFILLSSLWTVGTTEDILWNLGKYSKILVALLFLSMLTESIWRRRCLIAFVLGMLFIMFSTYANIWLDLPWSNTNNQGWGQDHHVVGSYITQSIMMVFLVLVLLVQGLFLGAHQRWLAWGLASLSAIAVLQLSPGRTGYVLLICIGAIFFLGLLLHLRSKRNAVISTFIVIIGLFLALASSSQLQQRIRMGVAQAYNFDTQPDTSIGIRINLIFSTFELWKEKPLLGHGSGSYRHVVCQKLQEKRNCDLYNRHPENQYSLFAVQQGMVGVLLFVWILIRFALLLQNQGLKWKMIGAGFLAMLIINSMFNSSLFSARESHFFFFMLALLSAQLMLPNTAAKLRTRKSPTESQND
jgi:O-antigen ligase